HIKIGQDAKEQLLLQLKTINSKQTPEQYVAYSYAQCIVVGCVGILLYLFSRFIILLPTFAVLCYLLYKKRTSDLQDKFTNVQNAIEKDLPKLCSVINSKLAHTNNTENILKSFYPIACDEMRLQLDITLADMESGNVVQALQRFEERIHSPHLLDITRGLIAVQNGDDQRIYFEVKQQELNREYEMLLQREINKRPNKLRPMQFVILLLFLACLMYPMGTYMLGQTGALL
ncbi:MAG: hypothetical protein RR424_09955, partial [Oscillospiraceae bacterium]